MTKQEFCDSVVKLLSDYTDGEHYKCDECDTILDESELLELEDKYGTNYQICPVCQCEITNPELTLHDFLFDYDAGIEPGELLDVIRINFDDTDQGAECTLNEIGLFFNFVYDDVPTVTFKEVADCTMDAYLKMVGDVK